LVNCADRLRPDRSPVAGARDSTAVWNPLSKPCDAGYWFTSIST
jgi:hypothetical protein